MVFFVGVSASAVTFVRDPQGFGGLLFGVTSGILLLGISLGPTYWGVRPRRLWFIETLGGGCLLLSLLGDIITVNIGPMGFTDITYFTGYVLLILWLGLLAHRLDPRRGTGTFLNTTAAAVGTALALWVTALARLTHGSDLPGGLVWAVYPTADVILLALTVQLVLRTGYLIPALTWLIASLAMQLTLDCVYSISSMLLPQGASPMVLAGYLFSFLGVAMAATHPSVLLLSRRPGEQPTIIRRSRRPTALIVFTISPAILSTVMPVTGLLDTVVRTILLVVLLALLFLRLSRTMNALSEAEADSVHRATHDELTGLLNRAALLEALDHRLAENAEKGTQTAVLFLDCDDFKYVNDTWGHRAGDSLLRDIATHLPGRLPSSAVLARHGGDEFALAATVGNVREAIVLARQVQAFFAEPRLILPGRVHMVASSIGIALARPGEDVTTNELLTRADLAMYAAKESGRGRYALFTKELAECSHRRAAVGDRLDEAISGDVFHLQLQPIMGGSGYEQLIGWEALARWHDPHLGDVPPDVFVPLAEQLGLICDLGHVLLFRACRELAQLRRELGRDDVAIFVNVSPAQLLQPEFADSVLGAVDAAGLPRDSLRLEVTETLLVDRGPDVLHTLRDLRDAGVRICIDDFGTGFASLATLLRLPIDCVKLDRSLVSRLGTDTEAPRQVRAVIGLVHSLGIADIVAEGVECADQEQALRELGCPMVQGWYYGRPETTAVILAAAEQGSAAKIITEAGLAARPKS